MAENSDVHEEHITDMVVNDSKKPTYVRKLSFGETILNLNTADRETGSDDNKIIVDEKVEGIPRTEKKDFVRNWIEIHNNDEDLSSKEYIEPVQGSSLRASTSKSLPNASPILGVRKYQNNERPKSENNVNKNDQVSTSPILSSLKQIYRKKSNSPAEEKQNKLYKHDHQFNIKNILSINNSENNSSQNVIMNKSPELVKDANDHKKTDEQDFTNNIQMGIESHGINKTDIYGNRNMNLQPLNEEEHLNHSDPGCSMPVTFNINSQIDNVSSHLNEINNYSNRNMNLQPLNEGKYLNHSDPECSMPVTYIFNINNQMDIESHGINERDKYSIRNMISQPLVPYESFNHSGLGCSMPATIPWVVHAPMNNVRPDVNEIENDIIRNMISSIPLDPYEGFNRFRPRYFRPSVINENVQMDNVSSNGDEIDNSSDIDMNSKPLNLSKNLDHSDPGCSIPVTFNINSQIDNVSSHLNETNNYSNRNMNSKPLNLSKNLDHSDPGCSMPAIIPWVVHAPMNNVRPEEKKTDDDIRNMISIPSYLYESLNHSSPEFSMSAARQRRIYSIEDNQEEEEIDASKNIIVPTSSNFDIIEDDIIIGNCSSHNNTFKKRQNLNSPSPEFSMSAAKKRKIDYVKFEEKKSVIMYAPKTNDIFSSPNPPVIEANVIIKNNTIDENSSVIESVSSDDSNNIDQIEITNLKSDDDEIHHENIVIEDVDNNKDMIPLVNNSISGSDTELKTSCDAIDKGSVASSKDSDGIYYKIKSSKSIFPYKVKTKWASASLKDFGETSYSETESMKSESSVFQNDHALEKISQITSLSNGSVDNTSSPTSCISTPTSPEKTNSFPAISLQIIDSNKKQRRMKKKSLTAKLQSLVNRQISFVRIWQHQVKQADVDGTLIPHIDVYVDKCTTYMNRQFLEGFILNDSFNLLNNNSNQEINNCGESSYRMITIHIVPDIVGRIEMKLESIVKIYPPWDVMDESKLVLNITYIKIVSNEQRRGILNQINIPDRKKGKVLIKESDCICLESKKIISSCKKKSNNIRVDVMNEVFSF